MGYLAVLLVLLLGGCTGAEPYTQADVTACNEWHALAGDGTSEPEEGQEYLALAVNPDSDSLSDVILQHGSVYTDYHNDDVTEGEYLAAAMRVYRECDKVYADGP